MTPILIFGAGGHAREVAQLISDIELAHPGTLNLLGFVADLHVQARIAKPLPAHFLGSSEIAFANHPNASCVIAVGDPQGRSGIAARLMEQYPNLQFPTLIHPGAWHAERVNLGPGSVIFAGALVNVDVKLGAHGSINLGCTISHDCALGEHVSLGPGVHLAGAVEVGDKVDIGAGAIVRPGVKIGSGSIIGAGAVVVHDIPAHSIATGVPANSVDRSQWGTKSASSDRDRLL